MNRDVPSVVLAGSAMVPLVRAAAALASAELPPYAVIGGIAVTARLGRVLRATADLDAVTDQRHAPTAVDILRKRRDTVWNPADPHTVMIDGSQVQFQEVEPVTDDDVKDLDGLDLLYVVGHAHALDAATPMRILAVDGAERADAVVPVASPGALVAMKLHAYLDRRRVTGPDKRPGDMWDIYNLLLHAGVAAAEDVALAGARFRYVVKATVHEQLIDGAGRARSILRLSNDDRYQAITAEEISLAAKDFLARLQRLAPDG